MHSVLNQSQDKQAPGIWECKKKKNSSKLREDWQDLATSDIFRWFPENKHRKKKKFKFCENCAYTIPPSFPLKCVLPLCKFINLQTSLIIKSQSLEMCHQHYYAFQFNSHHDNVIIAFTISAKNVEFCTQIKWFKLLNATKK